MRGVVCIHLIIINGTAAAAASMESKWSQGASKFISVR